VASDRPTNRPPSRREAALRPTSSVQATVDSPWTAKRCAGARPYRHSNESREFGSSHAPAVRIAVLGQSRVGGSPFRIRRRRSLTGAPSRRGPATASLESDPQWVPELTSPTTWFAIRAGRGPTRDRFATITGAMETAGMDSTTTSSEPLRRDTMCMLVGKLIGDRQTASGCGAPTYEASRCRECGQVSGTLRGLGLLMCCPLQREGAVWVRCRY
jgi:hypothetical protein